MKSPTSYSGNCKYSFNDLYKAACHKNLTLKEKNRIRELKQDQINQLVKDWTQKAGWYTQKVIGSDAKEYLAFSPREKEL